MKSFGNHVRIGGLGSVSRLDVNDIGRLPCLLLHKVDHALLRVWRDDDVLVAKDVGDVGISVSRIGQGVAVAGFGMDAHFTLPLQGFLSGETGECRQRSWFGNVAHVVSLPPRSAFDSSTNEGRLTSMMKKSGKSAPSPSCKHTPTGTSRAVT